MKMLLFSFHKYLSGHAGFSFFPCSMQYIAAAAQSGNRQFPFVIKHEYIHDMSGEKVRRQVDREGEAKEF